MAVFNRRALFINPNHSRRGLQLFPHWLSFFHVIGLITGALCASFADSKLNICWSVRTQCSFLNLLFVGFFPFVASFIIYWIWGPEALIPVAFMEAFRSSFLFGTFLRLSAVGWVIRLLPCFLDFCRLPVLVFFLNILYLEHSRPAIWICAVLYMLLVCIAFYYVVLPFWVQL